MHNKSQFISYSALFVLLFLSNTLIRSQDQNKADSLIHVYDKGNYEISEIELLNQITINATSPEVKLAYAESLLSKAHEESNIGLVKSAYLQKGNALQSLGRNGEALRAYFESLKVAKSMEDLEGIGSLSVAIAGHYSLMDDFENASLYFNKGIKILRKSGDSIELASALLNAGDNYILSEKLDSAFTFTKEAQYIFKEIPYALGEAYSSGNLGIIYAEMDADSLAVIRINDAIKTLENHKDYYAISVYLTYMSDIYAKKEDWTQAFAYAERSLDLAMEYGLKDQMSDAYLQLSELYESRGRADESLANYKNHIVYRDSVTNIATVQEMADLRINFEVSQKQTEVDLLEQQRKNQQLISLSTGIGLILIVVLAVGLYRRNRFINKSKVIIENEKERSDLLLRNILPEQTAEELKDKGSVTAKRFESVSVMFTDFKGFTSLSNKLSPEELVDSIDFYYSNFDAIIEKHGLEKIKTVGDAYMCAGGLPNPTEDHPCKMIEAALEIAEFVSDSKKSDPDSLTRFDIRIGINTGAVVAGVVGKKKFAYDIWGDTVNIASRMESNSEPGKINISHSTYQLVKNNFSCTYRGEIEAKNKGMLKMYFVEEAG